LFHESGLPRADAHGSKEWSMNGGAGFREGLLSGGAAVQRWHAPAVSAGGGGQSGSEPALSAERLAEIEADARAAGYRRGYEEGERKGLAQRAAEAARLHAVLEALAPQTVLLDERLADEIAAVVRVAIRQFVRRELTLQSGEVVRVIREALDALPSVSGGVTVALHPEDAALVREVLHADVQEQPWRIVEDLALARGGARLETETSAVDASVETRLGALVARLLGDARQEPGDA
jgi:flagellar assembly protein FliH